MALAEAAKEATYLRYLLEDLGYNLETQTVIYCDSQSAQHMANFGGHHSRTKHIHYRYHFIRDAIENQIVELKYMPTNEMPADVLTKPLNKIKHEFCITKMGMQLTNG